MEITIEKDEVEKMIYTTTIRVNNKDTILETLWHGRRLSNYSDDAPVNNWISMIKKIEEKKREKTQIISLLADRSEHYRNSTFLWRDDWLDHLSKDPFELLQVCVDNHCLFHQTEIPTNKIHIYRKYSPPTSLLKLLSDNKTIVVGLGIENVAKKLENDFNIKISKWVDLRIEARKKGYGHIANNCSVVTLAKKILGDEWDVKEPTNMNWWANADYLPQDFLSDDKVKFGSLETFLAYRIGTKLLKD